MFVTPDSIMQAPFDPQSLNRYAYCRNNPLIYTDPTGHSIPELGQGDHRTPESVYKDIEKKIESGRHFGNDEEVLGSHFQEQSKENLLAEAKFQIEKSIYDKNRISCGCKFGEPVTQIGSVSISKAMMARILASESLINAQKSGLPGLHNGPADALRHCEWSCRMAQEIGPGSAKTVGNVHELCGNGPPGETAMDLNNNSVGIGLGQPGVDCYGACIDALNNGALQTSPGGVPPNIVY